MLMNTTGAKTLAAVSSLELALLPTSMNSALEVSEDVPLLVVVVVVANLILDLMVASSFIPTSTTIAKTPTVTTTPDYLLLKPTAETLAANASKVPCLLPAVLVKLPSASSTLAVVLPLTEESLSASETLKLSALKQDPSLLKVIKAKSIAPIPTSSVRLLVLVSALVDAWVEVLALTVSANARLASRVEIALLEALSKEFVK